jgi:hypothetical protein
MLRRKFFAYLGALPVIADWKEALGHARPKARVIRDQKWKDGYLAVETLRLINTVEKWNFLATGQHVSVEHLHECVGYKKLIERLSGRFQAVLAKFPSDGGFQMPGYNIFVAPNTDLSRYVATVSMKGPDYKWMFVSDEVGTIYEGGPPGTQAGYNEISKFLVDARAMVSDAPTPNGEAGWWPRLLATIMFSRLFGFAIPPQGANYGCACCYSQFPCPVPGSCYCQSDCPNTCTGGDSYCCVNCGTCSGCTWVRNDVCEYACNCWETGCNVYECCFSSGGTCICQCG